MSDKQPPLVDEKLVAWLEELFPNKLPSSILPHDDLIMLIGQQQIMAKLRSEVKRQQSQRIQTTRY